MNWQEIKEKYPKALSNATNYTLCLGFIVVLINNTDRWLYDFFDEQGIIISMKYLWKSEVLKIKWKFEISNEFELLHSSNENYNTYKTRTEAEEQAFTKAFEILEQRLNADTPTK